MVFDVLSGPIHSSVIAIFKMMTRYCRTAPTASRGHRLLVGNLLLLLARKNGASTVLWG